MKIDFDILTNIDLIYTFPKIWCAWFDCWEDAEQADPFLYVQNVIANRGYFISTYRFKSKVI